MTNFDPKTVASFGDEWTRFDQNTISEKEAFLNRAANEEFILFFEHDSVNECCTVQHTEKGVRLKETFDFSEI